MRCKLFGDTQAIDWQALGVRMPFAPMYKLAKKYELEQPIYDYNIPALADLRYTAKDLWRTFELTSPPEDFGWDRELLFRIGYRTMNTLAALDRCTPDTICINLGGGYTHAEKYPNTGYAYSLINDICWAVDYQLEQDEFATIAIVDMDFHLGGGTAKYYTDKSEMRVAIYDQWHSRGILMQHNPYEYSINALPATPLIAWPWTQAMADSLTEYPFTKILLNIGTDWFIDDCVFGKYGQMPAVPLIEVWLNTVQQIIDRHIPLAITMGGGYGEDGLQLYENFISCLRDLQPQISVAP